jgi:hypothetical protein
LEPNTCAKNKNLLPIAAEKDEIKLLYSLDTLGYIEFDTFVCSCYFGREFLVC